MDNVEEAFIRSLAEDLVYISQGNPIYRGFSADVSSPRVNATFEAFEGLPADHPLKKEFDPVAVKKGYMVLKGIGVHDAWTCDQLKLHLYLP
ncbi:hypothetical protein JXB02_04275 [Candidatus Woesearchaeota archaeon]|nr:hypothetical protein [Candidatus Woesearchaeota archaeon]